MKETITPVQILSKRAQEFLNSPRHFKKTSAQVALGPLTNWEFSFEQSNEVEFQSDKILTLFYSDPIGTELELLFKETISRLAIGKNILFLEKLTFRELENYLRDENHQPVFDISVAIRPEAVCKVVIFSLQAAIIINKIKNNFEYRPVQKGWSELSLVEKNRETKAVVSLLNSLFPRVKPMELALADNEEISVVMNEFPISREVIEVLMQGLFVNSAEKSSLKVVAVQ